MLQPKRTKFRKMHKGRNRGLAQGTDVSFGSFGLKAVGRGRLTARQIEAARRAMTRAVKCQGKDRIVCSRTNRSLKSRWQCVWVKVKVTWRSGVADAQWVSPYCMDGVPEELAREAFKLAAAKLPIKTTFCN